MLTLDRTKFATLTICDDFLAFVDKAIDDGLIETVDGKFHGKATMNSIGILKFPTNGRETSIAGMIAGKNGYASLTVFKGTDFYTAGGAFVESVLRAYRPHRFAHRFAAPAPKSPKVSETEMATMKSIVEDLGI